MGVPRRPPPPPPPLLQGLAPLLPADKGIQHLQHQRQQWRLGWPLYVSSLRDLVTRMLRDERNCLGEPVQITSLESTIQSIDDDIQDVLAANPDICDGLLSGANRPRTTPSYLAYCADRLRYSLNQLQRDVGSGDNPSWPSGPHSTRVYGQEYPGDEFREILHYKPMTDRPAGWRLCWARTSGFLPITWPRSAFSVQVIGCARFGVGCVCSSFVGGYGSVSLFSTDLWVHCV
ncbi:hypothetical protein BDV97DRAFT_366783 [Delphinella strobiligena]|nr:hypothetical protein BDV97DRAFT_366783 [Delphinella strobiligena]